MPLYELRTYQLYVGKMAEAVKLYQNSAFRRCRRAATTSTWWDISRAIPV